MNNQGFSLLEIVVACLLFSVALLGLFNLQRFFYQQFAMLQLQQQQLSIAQQALASYPTPLPLTSGKVRLSLQPTGEAGCSLVTATLEQQSLARWYCE